MKFSVISTTKNCLLFLVLFCSLKFCGCSDNSRKIQYKNLLSESQTLLKSAIEEDLRLLNNHMFHFGHNKVFVNKRRKLIGSLTKTIQGIDSLNMDRFKKHIALMDSINPHKEYAFEYSEDAFENKHKLFKITLESLKYLHNYSLEATYRFGTILPIVQNPTVFEGDSITFKLHAQENVYLNNIELEILESPEIDQIITYNQALVKFATENELPNGVKSKKVTKKINVPIYNHFLNEKDTMFVELKYTVVERNE